MVHIRKNFFICSFESLENCALRAYPKINTLFQKHLYIFRRNEFCRRRRRINAASSRLGPESTTERPSIHTLSRKTLIAIILFHYLDRSMNAQYSSKIDVLNL